MINFGEYSVDHLTSASTFSWNSINFSIDKKTSYIILKNDIKTEKVSEKDFLDRHSEIPVITNDYLESECVKFFISIDPAFSPMFHYILPFIQKVLEYEKSTYFVIYNADEGGGEDLEIKGRNIGVSYLEKFLSALGANYLILTRKREFLSAVKVNNLFDLEVNKDLFVLTLGDTKNTIDTIKSQILTQKELNTVPFRKVYLSRSHLNYRLDHTYTPRFYGTGLYTDDSRMDNQEILESYFESKGYEIVIPESKFNSLAEQIKYFNETEIIVGVTGSALTNSLFMQDGQKVVDIISELVFEDEIFGVHQVVDSANYMALAYVRKQTYFGIPSRRDPNDVISQIDKLGII